MGTDSDVYGTISQTGKDLLSLFGFGCADQQSAMDAQRLQQLPCRFIMLSCQNFRGRHECALIALAANQDHRAKGKRCFTAAHVPLNQPAHGKRFSEIFSDLP